MPDSHTLAAVDLGSNSFRLEIGRVSGDQIYTLDTLREPVRLAAGLSKDKTLDRDSQTRALDALERFGERLRGFSRNQVRAVATNTFRVARNGEALLRNAEKRLGFPIEVIAGREEARLIYFGVAHLLAPGTARRLVVDIGGGSTELIIGTGYAPEVLESVYIGCVSTSVNFFAAHEYDKSAFRQAELAARRELEVVSETYRNLGWAEAIGSSGTARALAELLEANGLSGHGITRDGLERLRGVLIRAGRAANLRLEGLKADRVPVLAGGLAIMCAVFDELGIERMAVSDGALRTGVLYDLLGRANQEDMRETTVREFTQRYAVNERHAQRVHALAVKLWRELSGSLKQAVVPPMCDGLDHPERLLHWAAALHEVGRSIAHNGFHKHSAYILSNADMPGFSKREQRALSLIALAHTGKLPKIRNEVQHEDDWRLVACMRLAALLYRSRNSAQSPPVRLLYEKKSYRLEVPRGWLEANPLTEYDLRQEIEEWRRLGYELALVQAGR